MCVRSFGRALLIIGALASISNLIINLIVYEKAYEVASEAPDLLEANVMEMIESRAPALIDKYVDTKLMPGIRNEILGMVFGMQPQQQSADEISPVNHHSPASRSRNVKQCPVSDTSLCQSFRETCVAFDHCKTTPSRETCLPFVQKLNVACAQNYCSAYYDQDLCHTVDTMCGATTRCMFDQTACIALRGNLTSLCDLVV